MAEQTLSARLVEAESMLDRSRRRFEEGTRLVEEAHTILADVQQALIGSPRTVSPEDSEEAASKLLTSLKAAGGEMPKTRCGGRLAVAPMQRLIRGAAGSCAISTRRAGLKAHSRHCEERKRRGNPGRRWIASPGLRRGRNDGRAIH